MFYVRLKNAQSKLSKSEYKFMDAASGPFSYNSFLIFSTPETLL